MQKKLLIPTLIAFGTVFTFLSMFVFGSSFEDLELGTRRYFDQESEITHSFNADEPIDNVIDDWNQTNDLKLDSLTEYDDNVIEDEPIDNVIDDWNQTNDLKLDSLTEYDDNVIEDDVEVMTYHIEPQLTESITFSNGFAISEIISSNPRYSEFITDTNTAFSDWTKVNPTLIFLQVDESTKADIHIEFSKEIELEGNTDRMGLHQFLGFHRIYVDSGDVNCKGEFVHWSQETITDTIKHEIGHMLGLEHSLDFNNLMYSEKEPTSMEIDTLGYITPEPYDEYTWYVGQKLLRTQYDEIPEVVNSDEYELTKQMYEELICFPQ